MPADPDDDATRATVPAKGSLQEAMTAPGKSGAVAAAGGPAIGARWARYRLLDSLGEGGMGVVYAAHDDELDRTVALKVLHDESLGRAAQQRLRREARAMARIAHPNVVPVYDVGEHAGRSYYTMELVRGQSLRDWLRERRSWPEVQRVFLDAARGLAAIHHAGLVHRDVKPGNLLLGDDGRARITDLGIALGDPSLPGGAPIVDTTTALNAGTPAFMAPEQLEGDSGDARSDQFAFGVSLYEALHGQTPFVGDSLPLRARSIQQGPRPPARELPRWLHDLTIRSIAADPARRFPSMAALVRALEGPQPRLRRWPYLAAAVAAVTATAVIAAVMLREDSRPIVMTMCRDAGTAFGTIWTPARRAALIDRLEAAPEAAAALVDHLDSVTGQWKTTAQTMCQRVRNESWPYDLQSRGSFCLLMRAAEIDLVVHDAEGLEPGPHPVFGGLHQVMTPMRCLDREFLLAQAEPPRDQTLALLADAARRMLLLAAIRIQLGHLRDAERMLRGAEILAIHIGYAPILAELAGQQAAVQRNRGDFRGAIAVLDAAYFDMRARGADAEAQALAAHLVQLAIEIADDELAARWVRTALADAARRPGAAETSDVYYAAAQYEIAHGDLTAAAEHATRSLELAEKYYGPRSMAAVTSAGMVAIVLDSAGRPAEAIPHYERQLGHLSTWYGDKSPHLAFEMQNLGLAHSALAHHDQAIALLQRAVALLRNWRDAPAVDLGRALLNLGVVQMSAGHDVEAIEPLERALEMLRSAVGEDHPDVALTLANIGEAKSRLAGTDEVLLEEAVVALRAALDLTRRAVGAEHPETASAEVNLGMALVRQQLCVEAVPLARHALTVYERDHNTPATASPLDLLGQCQLESHRDQDAVATLERALAARGPDGDPARLATTFLRLALAHIALGDLDAGVRAMRSHREQQVAAGADAAALAKVDAWLANPARSIVP